MACRFITTNGKITGALNQAGGKSELFDQLNEKYGLEKALELYAVSESEDFQELFGGNQNKAKLGQDIKIISENEMPAELEVIKNQRLEGAPIVEGATGADPNLTAVAEQYAKDNGIDYKRQSKYVEVDEDRAKRIAQAYEDMQHDPKNPIVSEAYENLIQQTKAQYNALIKAGYQFYFFDETNDPYQGNPYNAMRDLRANKVMASYSTEAGFGSDDTIDVSDNPMLVDTGLEWGYGSLDGEKRKVLANDLFRCFTPETLVRTSEGFRQIQDIKVGDLVLTHEGRFKKVYETIKNPHKGEILSISTNASYNPIKVTLEHPFYVLKENHRNQKSSICTPYICDRKQQNGNIIAQEKYHSFDWVEAKDLKEKTWFPLIVDTAVKDLDFIEIPDKHYVGKTKIPKKIALTEDFLSFVGLYIAEGSGGTNRININLHKDEQYLIDLVDRFAKSIGYEVKSRVIGNGIVLQINCKILKWWFSEWLGRGSNNKKIPNEFLQLPPEKLKHIAYGIFSGDGKKANNCIEQTSLTLALQLVEVGSRLGMQPTTNKINHTKNVNHSNTYTTHEFLKSEHNFKQKKYTWKILDKDCRSITKINKEYYEGFVYNIEVEDDHSYVVENVPVHNCVHDAFGHGLEGAGFRARGEENAWQSHVKLFTGSAIGAITSETRGQNSWLNYGKYGEQNKTAKVEDTVFGEQKTGLMPEWTWTEGVDKPSTFISGGAAFANFFANITNTENGGAKFKNVQEVLNKPIEGFEKELEAYLKYGKNFQKHIMASIPAFVDARIRALKGMVEASAILGKNGKEVNMLDITSSEGYFTKAFAQLAQDRGVNAKADALDAGVTFQRDFNEAPQVKGVNYLLQAWGESFVDPDSGIAIPLFKPTKKYGVIFEGMGFQFFTPTREKEIAEVKSMMEQNGLFVTMEKLKNEDYQEREKLKDEFKSKFFTQEEMAQKAATVLKKSDEASVGMMDYQFDRVAYEKVLSKNFNYVVQFYSAGNFAGYYASDNLEVINTTLKNTGDTTTKYNEELTPKIIKEETKNGQFKEVDSNTLLRYITNKNKTEEKLTKEQLVDLQDFNNFDKERLLNTFYGADGVFSINEIKLTKSKLYKPYEVSNIIRNIDLQETIKDSLERLKNTEVEIENTEQERGTTNEFNSFGKLVTSNPFLAQKVEDKDNVTMSDSEFQDMYNKEKNKDYKVAEVLVEVEGEIRQRKNTETELILPITAKETENTKVQALLDIRFESLQDNEVETRDVLNQIEDDLIKDSIDVIGLSEKPIDANLLNYLTILNNFIKAPTVSNSKVFADLSDEYFSRDLSPKKELIKAEQGKEYVKLETTLSEEEVYNQQGLIKLDDSTYIKTAKENLTTLYENLRTYTEKYPKDKTLEEYIQEQLKGYSYTNAETAEAIILYKMYFDAVSEVENDAIKQVSNFTGDYNYLTEDFPSDFYSNFLAEKKLNSKLFRNFYSNFEINEKGINLINTDEISLRNIKIYADENLKQYSILSKQMPNLSDNSETTVNPRVDAINNPTSIKENTSQVSKINQNEVVIKNSADDFIKIGGDIYESVAKQGNLNHYVKLEKNHSDYYSVKAEAPQINLKLSDYKYLNETSENFKSVKDFLKGENPEELNC